MSIDLIEYQLAGSSQKTHQPPLINIYMLTTKVISKKKKKLKLKKTLKKCKHIEKGF